MIMSHSHRSIIAAFVSIMLAFGSVGSAAAGFLDCLPKSCCCMQGDHKAAAHMLQMDANSGCTRNAPCCQMEPAHKAQAIAALPYTPELPKAKAILRAAIAGQRPAAQLTPSLELAYHHNGKPGAPLVPLYLETQMLLC